ncbi:hypothetical protein GCM10027414_37690 [Humibacter ginsengiterrae]
MLVGALFLLMVLGIAIVATVVLPVLLFLTRSDAKRRVAVMEHARQHLVAELPNPQSTWSRSQWESAITVTSDDRYLYLLDRPAALPPTRAAMHGPWWAIAILAVFWVLVAAWFLNGYASGRPISRAEVIGTWTGQGNAGQGKVVVELRRDGTYIASGFRFPKGFDHSGTWMLFNFPSDPKVDLRGRTTGYNIDITWNYFQPTISVCNGDPDSYGTCTTLTKTGPAN